MRTLSFNQALQILSRVLGISIAILRNFFAGNEVEAIRLAKLPESRILAAYKVSVGKIRLAKVQADFNVSKRFAKELYSESIKYSTQRIKKVIWKKGERVPAGIRKSDIIKHGRILKRGKLRGRYQVFVDTLYNLPIDGKLAAKEKRKIREMVFTKGFMETPLSKLKSLRKFVGKTTETKLKKRKKDAVEKRKLLTKAEAKKAAKSLNDKFFRQDVFESVSEVFGY